MSRIFIFVLLSFMMLIGVSYQFGLINWDYTGSDKLPVTLKSLMPIEVVQVVAPFKFVDEQSVKKALIEIKIEKMFFFNIDMRAIKRKLSQNPWVKDIKISRVWPNKIKISFQEDEAIAILNDNYLVTRKYCKLSNFKEELRNKVDMKDLVILSGSEKNSKKLCDTLAKLKIYVKPIDIRIKKLVMSPRNSWMMQFENGLSVLLGNEDIFNRALRFKSFYTNFGSGMNAKARTNYLITRKDEDMDGVYIDMRYRNGLAVGRDKGIYLTHNMETA